MIGKVLRIWVKWVIIHTDIRVCQYRVNIWESQVGYTHEAEWLAQDIAGHHPWQVSKYHNNIWYLIYIDCFIIYIMDYHKRKGTHTRSNRRVDRSKMKCFPSISFCIS